MAAKVNILGSCVSRIAMLDGDLNGHGIADDDIDLCYYLADQNIVCAMTPAVFTQEEIDSISENELYKKSNLRGVKQNLAKKTVDMLLNSDAQWLIMDLYDMHNNFFIFREGLFHPYEFEFFNTSLYQKYKDEIAASNFMKIPKGYYYGYIDLFFEKIMKKYDSDHIILNRFRSNTYYITKQGMLGLVPDNCKNQACANDNYNHQLYELEEYIINKYNPYVIDLSKYFMGDENFWNDDLNGAHFEMKFYRETFKQIKRIIKGETKEKYFSDPNFFSNENIEEYTKDKFDIENGILSFLMLLDKNDLLWMNILDKLNMYAPDDERVKQYMQFLSNSLN